MKIYISILTV